MAVAEGRYFFIRSRLSGQVLDVKGMGREPGTQVFMWPKKEDANDNQLWYEDHVTGTLRSKLNDFCLELIDESTVVLNPYDPSALGQRWMVGGDRIQMKANPRKVLDIIANNCDAEAELCAWDLKETRNQLWYFEYEPARYFHLKSRMNGKVLDVEGRNTEPGARVVMWEQQGGVRNQLWYISRDGLVRSKLNGFVLDSTDEGGIRMQPHDPSNDNQGYCISDGKIANINKPELVIDIKNKDNDDGAIIIAWEYHGKDNQLWDIEYCDTDSD